MPWNQRIFALIMGITIFLVIVDLVRRRRMRVEYSLLWLATGAALVVLGVWHQLVIHITKVIGAALPMSTLFFFGLIFLMLINLHYSVKISSLTDKINSLTQELALLKDRLGIAGGVGPHQDEPAETDK